MKNMPAYALCFLGFVATTAHAATAAQVRINAGTLAPRGSSYHQAMQQMAQQWAAIPGGGPRLVVYPDGSQGGEADMVRLLRVGTLQGALLTAVGLTDIVPEVAALQNVPMLYRSLDEFDYVTAALQPELTRRFAAQGLVVLFWADAGWVRYFSTTPMRTPADWKKRRVFAWAGSPEQIALLRNSGTTPVPLETNEIAQALATGQIDAVTAPPIFALVSQFAKRAPYMLDLNWAPLAGAFVIRKDVWDRFSPAERSALQSAADEAGTRMRQGSRREAIEAVAKLEKNGVTVEHIPPEVVGEWQQMAEKAYPQFRGTMVPAPMFDEVQRLLREYRAGLAAR